MLAVRLCLPPAQVQRPGRHGCQSAPSVNRWGRRDRHSVFEDPVRGVCNLAIIDGFDHVSLRVLLCTERQANRVKGHACQCEQTRASATSRVRSCDRSVGTIADRRENATGQIAFSARAQGAMGTLPCTSYSRSRYGWSMMPILPLMTSTKPKSAEVRVPLLPLPVENRFLLARYKCKLDTSRSLRLRRS